MPRNMRSFDVSSGGFSVTTSAVEGSEFVDVSRDGSWEGSRAAEELEDEAILCRMSQWMVQLASRRWLPWPCSGYWQHAVGSGYESSIGSS